MKPTDIDRFMHDLNGGVFAQQIAHALSDVAAGVVDHNKPGEVTIKLKLKKLGEGHQVSISHTLDYNQPTKRGKKREDTTTETPMHVTPNGLELFPTAPTPQMFTREEAPASSRA